jgi:DNA-binding response OmpR family regulator
MAANILIVEDQYAFMIRELLELYGEFEFEIVGDGLAIFERLSVEPWPDLVLLDLWLPDISGLEVLDAIRQLDSRFPVIVVSAYGDKRTRQEAARRGANDFFQKPFSSGRLYRRIQALLAATAGRAAQSHPAFPGLRLDATARLAKQRRLLKLKEQQALRGIDSSPELLIEIEDLERELNNT